MGCRTGDVACRAGGAGVSVPPAHDGKRQAGADQNDGRARLDGGRAWLAGQGDDTATGGLEPATSCGPAAPQARSAAGAPRSHPAGAAVAQLCRGWARSGDVGIRRVGDLDHRPEAITSRPLLMQAIARQTQHAGQVTLTLSSTHGDQHKARRAYLRIAGFLARLRETAEQLDPVQRWYRILSEALKRYLKGRQLDPPPRLAPA